MTTWARRVAGVLLGLFGCLLIVVAIVPFAICWLLFHGGTQAIDVARKWTK